MGDAVPTERELAASSRGWSTALTGGLLVYLVVRTVVAAISIAAWWLQPGRSTDAAGVGSVDNGGGGVLAVLHHWDSNYFLVIASGGYFPDPPVAPGLTAFFPGYPLVGRAVAELLSWGSPTNVTVTAALFVVSSLGSLAAAVVLWRLVELTGDPGAARFTTVLFLAGPYSVFLYANYSEGLFLAFAIAAWYCAVRDRWWLVGMWCALAGVTRINGCFLIAALAVMYVQTRHRDGRPLLTPAWAWVLLAATGVAGYFGYLAVRTGDLLAWNTAQAQGWGRGLHWPWEAFYQTAGRVLFASTPDRRAQFAMDIVAAAAIVLAIVVWARRRDWPPAVYAGLTVLALTTSFTFVSLARNSLTLFPAVILLAWSIRRFQRRWAAALLTVGWTGLFLINTTLFAFGYWTD